VDGKNGRTALTGRAHGNPGFVSRVKRNAVDFTSGAAQDGAAEPAPDVTGP
jgi:hypothetical protein